VLGEARRWRRVAVRCANNAPVEFSFWVTIDANQTLSLILHEAYLQLAKTWIEVPAGGEMRLEFRAAINTTAHRRTTGC